MPGLGGRWRSEKPETVILAGCVLAFAGNTAWILWTVLAAPPEAWRDPVLAASMGLALSIGTPFALSRRKGRTARNFGFIGLLASAIALLTYPGVVGGGVALAGAAWGILATYEAT